MTTDIVGFISLIDGMDSGVRPHLLPDTKYALGVNLTSRGGSVGTRPGFILESELPAGKFQGAARWSLNASERMVYVISGAVYVYDPATQRNVGPLCTLLGDARCYFEQADRWMVIQDGLGRPAVLVDNDGEPALYGRDAPEVCLSIGTVMKYVHGRLHYSTVRVPAMTPSPDQLDVVPDPTDETGRTSIVSSDILNVYNPEYVFRMSEHRTLNGGGALALPQELGFVTAMQAMRNAATGTGVGPLVVAAREGMCAFDMSIPRDQRAGVNLSQVLFYGAGTISPAAFIPVNDDLMFLDTTGNLRSLKYTSSALAGSGGALSNVPMSNELSAVISPDQLESASMVCVDNRVMFTLAGYSGPTYRGVAVLDTAQVAGIGNQVDTPSYDGIWTGFQFQQLVALRRVGVMTTYAIVKSGARNVVVRQDLTAHDDLGTPIRAMLCTKAYAGESAPVNPKKLTYFELWLSGLTRDTSFSIYYRPYNHPWWVLAGTKVVRVGGVSAYPQTRDALRISINHETVPCHSVLKTKLNVASAFEFAIVWEGRASIDKFRAQLEVLAIPVAECRDNQQNLPLDGPGASEYSLGYYDYEVRL